MKRASILLASLLACGSPAIALAATPADVKEADTLFRDAQKLLGEGKTHEACLKFARSQELDAAIGTLLNLAKCHAAEGRPATARREFTEAARLSTARGPEDGDRAEYARKQAAELDTKVATVQLDLPAGATSVEVDGRSLPAGEWAAPVPLDPGEHRVVVTGPGPSPRQAAITVPPGPGALSLAVPLAAGGIEPVITTPGGDGAPPDLGAVAPDDPHHGRRLAGFVVGGAGLAAVAVGAVFGVSAIGKKGDEKGHCQGSFCDATGLELDAQAHRAAALSTVAVSAGIAAVGVGVVLVLVSGKPAKPSSGFLHIAPRVGNGGGGFDVQGTF
jgi:hypothetical protein